MPLTKDYADVITTGPDTQILSSARLWEHRCLMLDDDLSPDLIPPTLRESIRQLFDEATLRGVALDWSTMKVHIAKTDWANESHLVVRVDVL
jgi:hypothetical protein